MVNFEEASSQAEVDPPRAAHETCEAICLEGPEGQNLKTEVELCRGSWPGFFAWKEILEQLSLGSSKCPFKSLKSDQGKGELHFRPKFIPFLGKQTAHVHKEIWLVRKLSLYTFFSLSFPRSLPAEAFLQNSANDNCDIYFHQRKQRNKGRLQAHAYLR